MIDTTRTTISLRAATIPGHWTGEVRFAGRVVYATGLRTSMEDAANSVDAYCRKCRRDGRPSKGQGYV